MREHKSLKELSELVGIVPTSVGRKVDDALRIVATLMEHDAVSAMRMLADAQQDLRREREHYDQVEIANRTAMNNGTLPRSTLHHSMNTRS